MGAQKAANPAVKAAHSIEQRPVASLNSYERNARTHSPEQIAQLVASIQEFGFTNPVLIDETDTLIAGHGRLAAAQELGLDSVPCIVLDHLTPQQRRAYVIADNKLALNAAWDIGLLQSEIELLTDADFDIALLGFSDSELEGLASGGWDTDLQAAVDSHGENIDGIEGKIVVRCPSIDRDDLIDHLQRAIDESGIEGVSIA